MTLLQVKNLKTYFYLNGKEYPAVDDINFTLDEGKTMAIIGESGSGKSVTALSIMGLIDAPGKIIHGEIHYKGENLLKKSEKAMRQIRGNEISMIYQDPMTTLNPMNKVGEQIAEALIIHKKISKKEAQKVVIELMKAVGITDGEERYHQLPNQFSGGMRQRLMIAMAIACNPKILIADEPTTALDVTIQAEILDLLRKLNSEYNMSIILNTHDLGVVAEMADEVVVMYCGKVVEKGTVEEIFNNPKHPYTKGLLSSIPKVEEKEEKLFMIPGMVPNPLNLPSGCAFSDRCAYCKEACTKNEPPLIVSKDREVRCFLYTEKEGA